MAHAQMNDPVAAAYAQALIELAEDRGELEPVANDVDALRTLLDEQPEFVRFLRGPGIGPDDRAGLLDRTFKDKATPTLLSVLQVMNKKGRLDKLPQMTTAFERLMDKKLGKIEVDVTVARRLDDDKLNEVRDRVGRALGKQAVVHQYVDESILGGMVLRFGDRVIDSSVRAQLDAMRRRLLSAK